MSSIGERLELSLRCLAVVQAKYVAGLSREEVRIKETRDIKRSGAIFHPRLKGENCNDQRRSGVAKTFKLPSCLKL